MRRPSIEGWALVSVILGIPVLGLWLGLREWFPPVLSAHGSGIQLMLDYTLVVTGAFFVVGHLALAWLIASALRRRPEATPLASRKAQRLVGVIPAVVMAVVAEGGVMALGLPVWADYYGLAPDDAELVEVTGRQFFWAVRHPGPDREFGSTDPTLVSPDNPIGLDPVDVRSADDVVVLNELHLPTDRPALLRLRSYDVIHSFFVPELRLKQDMVPGLTVPVWFRPTGEGRFELACNQICGLGHYRMRGFLYLEDPESYSRWLGEQSPLAEGL